MEQWSYLRIQMFIGKYKKVNDSFWWQEFYSFGGFKVFWTFELAYIFSSNFNKRFYKSTSHLIKSSIPHLLVTSAIRRNKLEDSFSNWNFFLFLVIIF